MTDGIWLSPDWITVALGIVGLLSAAAYAIFRTGKWVGSINRNIENVKELAESVRSNTDAVKDLAKQFKKSMRTRPSRGYESGSPLKLTDLGQTIADRLGPSEIANQVADDLYERVKDKDEYEVQEACFEYMRDEYDPPDKVAKTIRKCAYDNGMDREEILDILAIVLRDTLLERQKA